MAQVVLSPIGHPICAWTQGSQKFAIYVGPDVLGRLGMEVRVASKRVPRRGLEIGGILLGRVEQRSEVTTFWIEGFESIDSEHRSGPSYILSEPDFALLQEALTKNGAASIGIYRSQTRSQELVLQETDSKLFERCFAGGDVLFLIACPVAARAAFFIRVDGGLKCVYEFGLGSPLGTGVAPPSPDLPESDSSEVNHPEVNQPIEPPPEIQPALLAVSRPIHPAEREDTASDSVPPLDRQRSLRLAIKRGWGEQVIHHRLAKPPGRWLGRSAGFKEGTWLAAALLFSVILGAGIGMLSHSPRPSVVHPQELPTKDLHLTVDGNGSLLRLHWDQQSSAIGNPSRAVLHIQDGEYQMVRNLAPSEFTAGSIAYEPRNRDVSFRVDVSSPTANGSGLVQVVNLSVQPAVIPVRPTEPLFKPQARSQAAELAPSPASTARSEAAAAVPVGNAKGKEDFRPTAFASSDAGETASSVRREAPPSIDLDKEPRPVVVEQAERAASPIPVQEPTVRVWPEAVAGSPWGRLVGKVPLVRRFRKPPKTSAPAPIFQAQPVLTNPAKQSITRPVSVDVRVDVGESGAVESAEVIEFSDPLNVALTNSALAAAVRWTFEPARSDDLAVTSKVILHFRFTP